MAHDSPTFADLLKSFRTSKGLSQMDLAEKAGLSRNGIADLERGARTKPRKETIQLLAEALGLNREARDALKRAAEANRPVLGTDLGVGRWPGTTTPLVGRIEELGLIGQVLEGSGPRVLVFQGPPGMGKTRLLSEAGTRATGQGWRPWYARCHRWSASEPYSPLAGLVAELWSAGPNGVPDPSMYPGLATLVGKQGRPDDLQLSAGQRAQERTLLLAEFSRFLDQVAGPTGTLLLLDDVQWAGEETIHLLQFLLRVPRSGALRVLLGHRDAETTPEHPLSQLLFDGEREGTVVRRRLPSLSDEESRRLIVATGKPDLETLVSRCQGIPFYLEQFRALGPGASGIPPAVEEVLVQQYGHLSSSGKTALGVLVLAENPVSATILTAAVQAAGEDPRTLPQDLDEGIRRGLVRIQGEDYTCSHDLAKEILRDRLGPLREATLHGALATALQAEGRTHPAVLARHLSMAGRKDQAAHLWAEAARRARRSFAWREAAEGYREACSLLPPLPAAVAAELRAEWAKVLLIEGRNNEAGELIHNTLDALRAAGEIRGQVRFHSLAMEWAIRQDALGEVAASITSFWPVAVSLGASPDMPEFLANWAYVQYTLKDLEGQTQTLAWAEGLLGHYPDPFSSLAILEAKALGLISRNRYREAARLTQDSILPFLEAAGDRYRLLVAALNLASNLLMLGDYTTMGHILGKAKGWAQEMEDTRPFGFWYMLACNLAYEMGQWDEVLSLVRESQNRGGTPLGFQQEILWEGYRVQWWRGTLTELPAIPDPEAITGSYALLPNILRAEKALLVGEIAEALEALDPLEQAPWKDYPGMHDWNALRACALALAGRVDEAGALADQAVDGAREAGLIPSLAETLRYRGWLRLSTGQREGAFADLTEALGHEANLGRPWARFRILKLLAPIEAPTEEAADEMRRTERQLGVLIGPFVAGEPRALA